MNKLAQINFTKLYNELYIEQGVMEGLGLANPQFRFSRALTPATLVTVILPYLFVLAGLAMLIMLIIGGFQFMTSGGDPKAAQEAKGRITNALIGFFIVFAAYWIVQIMAQILGLQEVLNTFKRY